MSNSTNSSNTSNNSFSHAFLPGLILGLIIGAVAGAFLPDWLGGPKLPTHRGEMGDMTQPMDHGDRDQGEDSLSEEDQRLIDDAMNSADDEIEDNAPKIDTPATLPSGG